MLSVERDRGEEPASASFVLPFNYHSLPSRRAMTTALFIRNLSGSTVSPCSRRKQSPVCANGVEVLGRSSIGPSKTDSVEYIKAICDLEDVLDITKIKDSDEVLAKQQTELLKKLILRSALQVAIFGAGTDLLRSEAYAIAKERQLFGVFQHSLVKFDGIKLPLTPPEATSTSLLLQPRACKELRI